jgi:hypothetical protein
MWQAAASYDEKSLAKIGTNAPIICKVDGWQTLATKPLDQPIDLAA